MLKIKQFTFNPFGVSTFIAYDSETKDAIVVDPGMADRSEYETFDKYISDNGLTVQQVINTHLHLDHCFGDNYVKDKYGVKVAASLEDASLGENIAGQARMFGLQLPSGLNYDVVVDVALEDGDRFKVGQYEFLVISVGGHSPGGLGLYCAEAKVLFAGDNLFQGSIGRSDLPGGNYKTLINEIKAKLLTLPDDTQVLPGHGGPTTIGAERRSNPYLV